jgi:hypothetical protein
MPWWNYDYDKRNLMVVICDTDMPWRNYVVISSRSRSLVMETANFNHIFEIWWRAVHWQRKPEKSEQSLQWPWWLWSYSSDHRHVPFLVDIIPSRHICATNDHRQVPFVVDIIPSRHICVTNDRNYVYDKRNLTVVICDTTMPWRNYVYDKRNLTVVICNTDMSWRNYVTNDHR